MQRLKGFRIFFSLAALLFIAKPFIGFGVFNQQVWPRISHSVLVKSFTKRMPESLQDADAIAEALHHQFSDPLMTVFSAITFLLAFVPPSDLEEIVKLTGKTLSDVRYGLIPTGQVYLLTGKLTI